MPRYDISLDLVKGTSVVPPLVTVRNGDVGTQELAIHVTEHASPRQFLAGEKAMFEVRSVAGNSMRFVTDVDGIKEPSGDVAVCVLPAELLASVGTCQLAYLTIMSEDLEEIRSTEAFALKILPGVDDDMVKYLTWDQQLEELWRMWLVFNEQSQEAEAVRVENEKGRVSAEEERDSEEQIRRKNEAQRKAGELKRDRAEVQREANETRRKSQETERKNADLERETRQAKNDADQAANNAIAHGWVLRYCTHPGVDMDPETLQPIVEEPSEGVLYQVLRPDSAEGDPDRYVGWIWVASEGRWELQGSLAAVVDPITTDQVDQVVDEGASLVGQQALTAFGLSYLFAKLKQWLADKGLAARAKLLDTARKITVALDSDEAASFDASGDVSPGVSGLLPLSHGGLGVDLSDANEDLATAQQTARDALGAASQNAVSLAKIVHIQKTYQVDLTAWEYWNCTGLGGDVIPIPVPEGYRAVALANFYTGNWEMIPVQVSVNPTRNTLSMSGVCPRGKKGEVTMLADILCIRASSMG